MLCNAAGEGLDYKAMGSIFSGLVQCGAWGCFDEFNRIEAEVLSVVSSQIRQIQEALKNGLTRFPFEGKELWPISSALAVLCAASSIQHKRPHRCAFVSCLLNGMLCTSDVSSNFCCQM